MANRYDKKATLLIRSASKDEYNQSVVIWSDVRDFRCKVMYNRAYNAEYSTMEFNTAPITFECRYVDDIDIEDNRIKYKDKLYEINQIDEVGREQYLRFRCERVVE